MLNRSLAITGALALAFAPLAVSQNKHSAAPEPFQQYTQSNLVSNVSGVAAVTDPNLVNAWGLSRSSTGVWWVSDNGTGLSTLYDGTGKIVPLVVSSTGTPTGTIFNGTTDFAVAPAKPAVFLFATEDGTLSGWNPTASATKAIIVVNEGQKSVFKGLTMAQASVHGGPLANYLYAANFRKGKVSVYNATFHHASEIEERFEDFHAPEGYAPFNVQNIGGNIYVAFAKQDSAKHDEVDGPGLGFVAVFRADGCLIQVLEHGSWFNGPWGMAAAPSDFGVYSHDVLIGNFGSGEILAFDPVDGKYRGKLRDATNKPITIQGLWGISFGDGGAGGPANSLYFGAGPDSESNGLLGSLTAIQNTAGNDQ
jgi:uncharacterized protein (TIGR03118 family)